MKVDCQRLHDSGSFRPSNPPSHANFEVFKTSPEKPGDWDLKPGDFQSMPQIKKNNNRLLV